MGVGLVVLLLSHAGDGYETGGLEPRQLTLHRARPGIREPDHLVRIEASVRVAEEHTEHALLHLREQRIAKARRRGPEIRAFPGRSLHSHDGYDIGRASCRERV